MSRAIRSRFRIVGAFVLMFTMIFAMAVSVKAAGPGRPTDSTITISYPDQETGADFSKEKYAYTTGNKVTIKNTSPIRLKLDITISAIQTKIYPDSKMEQFGIYYYSSKLEVKGGYIYLDSNESTVLTMDFQSFYSGDTLIHIYATKADVTDNGGKNFYQAKKISLEGTQAGVLTTYGNNPATTPRYFEINTASRHFLNIEFTCNDANRTLLMDIYNKSDSEMRYPVLKDFRVDGKSTMKNKMLLDPGTYVIRVLHRGSDGKSATYKFTLTGRDYIPATGVKLTCSDNKRFLDQGIIKKSKTMTFTAQTVPSNSDDKLSDIELKERWLGSQGTVKGSVEGQNKKTFKVVFSASSSSYTAGYCTVQVKTTNGKKSKALEIVAKPGKPTVTKKCFYNRIVFKHTGSKNTVGDMKYTLYIQNGKNWKKKTDNMNQGSYTVKNLKGNKTYKFKIVGRAKRADGGWIQSDPLYVTAKTVRSTKAPVSSVQSSNARVWYNEKWEKWGSGWTWRKYYYTDFTVTINFSKAMPEIKGIYVVTTKDIGGAYNMKGNKTRYSGRLRTSGSMKGKNITLYITPYYKNGVGPTIKKTVYIR